MHHPPVQDPTITTELRHRTMVIIMERRIIPITIMEHPRLTTITEAMFQVHKEVLAPQFAQQILLLTEMAQQDHLIRHQEVIGERLSDRPVHRQEVLVQEVIPQVRADPQDLPVVLFLARHPAAEAAPRQDHQEVQPEDANLEENAYH